MLQAQCNVFEGARGEVSLTAGGGLRQLPGLTETFENAALVILCGSSLRFHSLYSLSFTHTRTALLRMKWSPPTPQMLWTYERDPLSLYLERDGLTLNRIVL